MIDYSKSQKYIKECKENFKMKSEPVDFENQSISQTSISIKEELNESNNAQNDNSDLIDIVEFSDIKIENCENHFEGSENIVGSKKPKIDQIEIEDPLAYAHERFKPFECEFCQLKFTSNKSLTEHFRIIHDGKEPVHVNCPICEKSFTMEYTLRKHISTVHPLHQKNPIIKSKPVDFENPSISQSSIRIKEELNEINAVQNNNSDFSNFVELSEPKIENCENSYKESETECPKIFVGLSQPKLKINEDEFKETHIEDPLKVNSNRKVIVICGICDIHFKHQKSYNQHMRRVHFQNKKKTHYKCDRCNLTGLTIQGFKRHILSIHGKEIETLKSFKKSKIDDGLAENSDGSKEPTLEQYEIFQTSIKTSDQRIHFDLSNHLEKTEKIKEIQQPYSENTPVQDVSFMSCFDHSNTTQQANNIIQHQKVLTEMVQPYPAETCRKHQKAVLSEIFQSYPASAMYNAHALENGSVSKTTAENLQENSNMVKKRCYCKGCNKKDCGKCHICLQKPKFGGDGKGSGSNKRCLAKDCLKLPQTAKNEDLQQNPVDRVENPSKKIVINFSCLEPRFKMEIGNSNELQPNKRASSQIKCQVPPSKKPKKTESVEKEPKKMFYFIQMS